jgi:hypothetical protein
MGKPCSQSLVGLVSISIVGILGKNGLDENIERIFRTLSPRDLVSLFQKESDPSYLCL